MLVFNHPLYSLEVHPADSIIHFSWTLAHKDMSYADFKEACSNYVGYAFEHQTRLLLIDTRKFAFRPPEEFTQWREEKHYPRFYKLGVKKMAYLMDESSMSYVQNIEADGEKFATHYFTQEVDALNWLKKN